MKRPPGYLGGGRVIRWTAIDNRHHPTACTQLVAGTVQKLAAALAICECNGAYYLFGCDANWNTITDTWHETIEEALDQAEFEYEGVSLTWKAM